MSVSTKVKPIPTVKAPILEAIFEMRWELPQVPNTNIYRDPAYPLLYGRLFDRFKKNYTVAEDLPSVQAHPDSTPYVIRHRMRKSANDWPVVQVGPGILTINDATNYTWERFREEIIRLFEAFTDFYPASTFPLNMVKTELRAVYGIGIDAQESVLGFFNQKLHTKIELDPALAIPKRVNPKVDGMTMNLGFKLEQPVGTALLSMGSGQAEGKPAVIVQTLLQSIGENTPQDLGALDPWLDEMQLIARSWFETLCKGELIKRYTV